MRRGLLYLPLAAAIVCGSGFARAHDASPGHGDSKAATDNADKTTKVPAPPPAATDVAPPYEPQLLRLSELLGALAYLQDLCGHHHDGEIWRAKMTALLDAEAKTDIRRQRLAGAFNRGFRGYALTYRLCTPNAQAIIGRFLSESGKLAQEVARRYGPS